MLLALPSPLCPSQWLRAGSAIGAWHAAGVCRVPGEGLPRTGAELQAAQPSVHSSLALSLLLTPSFPILKGTQFFVCNFPQLLCFDDDSQLWVITKFH